MTFTTLVVQTLLLAGTVPPGVYDPHDGVTYPEHVTLRGRPDPTPIPSNDVAYPAVHVSFVKSGPPGPGVDVETDRNVYGTGNAEDRTPDADPGRDRIAQEGGEDPRLSRLLAAPGGENRACHPHRSR